MVNKLIVDISIEHIPVTHYSRFTLDQHFNAHHTFQLQINHDQIEGTSSITLAKSKDFIGKNLTVQFGVLDEAANIFTGIITKVEIAQTHGFQGNLLISGYSPDILIDRGPDLGSYLDKDLKTILQNATTEISQNDLDFQIKPLYRDFIDYVIQYNESDFEFINRLSAEYHEWFYYDGRVLRFGEPDQKEEVALIYGRDLHSLQYGLQVVPLNTKKFAYHSQNDQLLSAEAPSITYGSADLSHVISASNDVYSKRYNQPLNVRVNNQKEISTFVADEQKSLIAGLVNISGRGDNPRVGLGRIIDISTSMRNGVEFKVEDFGKFIVIAIHHEIDGVGHYHHDFEGISAETEKLPAKPMLKPIADLQLADVVDNKDPLGQGRIKVKFKWTCQTNDATEWLRVVSPDAGGTGSVTKNRGFVFIPEEGDQVMVGFEEGNVSRPIVMGSVFHGGNAEGGYDLNHLKTISTRSGNIIKLNDTEGSIYLEDPSGNTVYMDGKGNISINAPKNMTINVGENLNINVGKDSYTNVGRNMEVQVAQNKTVDVIKEFKLRANTLKEDIEGTKDVNIGGDLREKTSTTTHVAKDGDILIHSNGTATLYGNIDTKVNKS